jgi:hypothetical protein
MKRWPLIALFPAWVLIAQEGRWEGVIKQEGQNTLFSVDLDRAPEWRGSFTIPGRESAPPLELVDIQVDGRSVRFRIHDLPGDPSFSGVMGEKGDSIKGTLTQSARTVAFEMRRIGPAHVQPIPANTRLDPRFVGDWTGALKDGLKIVVHLHGDESGLAAGTLDTADGRAKNLFLSAINQSRLSLAFDVRLIGGSYRGTISVDGAKISGEWSQGGTSSPLILERLSK